MKAWIDKLSTFTNVVPPMWLLAALAALVGAGLLSAFVDALHENLRRGNELRLAQSRSHPALAAATDVVTAQAGQSLRLR
ncbi:MAG: hypothetical protein EOP35_17100 [Rubrivivax sp.]|nr:MAG: hypothetical protein EOP35_17100 [Rubrivivax sp.]